MKFNIFILITIILCLTINVSAQDTTLTTPSSIKVSASIAAKEIPLNRPLIFTIQVEWVGDLNRYEISEIEDPIVRNFTIKSNASASRTELVGGQLKAIRTFEFELIPTELGMGYIEGIIIKYIDKASGEGDHLITNRLEVKVIDPIPEPGSKVWLIKWVLLAIVIVAAAIGFFLCQKKKAEEKQRKAEAEAYLPIEQKFLEELKGSITLTSPDLNTKKAFSDVSLILRKYLAAKHEFGATYAITDEIISVLKQKDVSESLINNIHEVLSKCDMMKFSGGEGDRSDLERVYTLVEDILNENLI